MSQIYLIEVLHLPKVEYILVLIGYLDEIGFVTTLSNRKCIICDSEDTQVVEISKNRNGLYKIMHEAKINIVKDILTNNKLY